MQYNKDYRDGLEAPDIRDEIVRLQQQVKDINDDIQYSRIADDKVQHAQYARHRKEQAIAAYRADLRRFRETVLVANAGVNLDDPTALAGALYTVLSHHYRQLNAEEEELMEAARVRLGI